jgi:hypothetical protein
MSNPERRKLKWYEWPLGFIGVAIFWPVLLFDLLARHPPAHVWRDEGALGFAIVIWFAGWLALAVVCALGGLIFLR